MDPLVVGVIGIVLLFILLAAGVHIAIVLGVVGFFGSALIVGFEQAATLDVSLGYYIIANSGLLALPLFIFMGVLAGAGGIGHDIYTAISIWSPRRFKGSLGVATVMSCTAFGVVTGSSVVTSAVFSKVSAPEMVLRGYDKGLAYGITSAAGSIGMLIPPSILIVVFALLSQLSTGKLLIGGITPGIILAVTFSVVIMLTGIFNPAKVGGGGEEIKLSLLQRIGAVRLIWPIVIVAIIVIGGMFSGLFSANEAAAVGTLAIIIITVLTTRQRSWQILKSGIWESVAISGMIFLILVGASMFSRFLILSRITPTALEWIINLDLSNIGFIISIVVVYLILGCFLDSISILSITLPIVIPAATALHIDLIYFALISIVAIEVGLITPPVGLNVYAAKSVAPADVKLEDIFRGVFPFFLSMLAVLVIMIAFPEIGTFLPRLMFGG